MDHRDQHQMLRNEILYHLEQCDWDRNIMPHLGLAPDWGPRYTRLAESVRQYLESEHTQLDQKQWKETQEERHLQRSSYSLASETPIIES